MTAALRDEAQRLEYRSFSAPSRHRPGQLKPLSRAHRDMFKELSWKARSEGESWWSIKKLGEAIVVGRRQAQNLLYELQAAGLIEIEPRRRGSDRPDRAHTNLVRVQLSGTRVPQNGAHRANPGSTTRANPGSPVRHLQGGTRVRPKPDIETETGQITPNNEMRFASPAGSARDDSLISRASLGPGKGVVDPGARTRVARQPRDATLAPCPECHEPVLFNGTGHAGHAETCPSKAARAFRSANEVAELAPSPVPPAGDELLAEHERLLALERARREVPADA